MASSSDNQGLQIAVIVFALLTIVMSGATFYCYKLHEDSENRFTAAQKAAQDAKAAETAAQTEMERLKEMVGVDKFEKMDKVEAQFKTDMTQSAKTNFHDAIKDNDDKIAAYNRERTEERKELDDLKAKVALLEKNKDDTLNKIRSEAQLAADNLMKEQATFKTLDAAAQKDKADLTTQLNERNDKIAAVQSELDTVTKNTGIQVANLTSAVEGQRGIISELQNENPTRPDGRITHVDQRNRTVWIDRGYADGLRRQISFGVFAVDDNGVARKGSKAKIEVTKLIGPHTAEAAIIEDDVFNPIVLTDVIYTPLWDHDRPVSFALCGTFDLNADKIDDTDMLRDLMQLNGARLDSELLPDGSMKGEMTVQTRYMILGAPPKGAEEKYSDMQKNGKLLGIEVIPVNKFLDIMGWRDSSQVVNFGRGADPRDFLNIPNNKLNRPLQESNPAGRFRQRQAPPSASGSAFTPPKAPPALPLPGTATNGAAPAGATQPAPGAAPPDAGPAPMPN